MKKNVEKWHRRFINLAHEVASWSKDDSTKVGTVIMGHDHTPRSFGYNGFPEGVDDTIPERNERPLKYKYTEHGERNSIYHCAKNGIPIAGCIIYITHYPCSPCARGIIRSGLNLVVIDKKSLDSDYHKRCKDDIEISKTMFKEAGLKVIVV